MEIPTRKYGNSGLELTILGFGAMRLPGFRTRRYEEHMEEAVNLVRRGIESGINYIDSAQYYDNGYSEVAVGKAIKCVRDKVFISSKIFRSWFPMQAILNGSLMKAASVSAPIALISFISMH